MHDSCFHHSGNGTHSFQQIVSVHDRPRHSRPSGQSAEVPRYVPVCVYRTFHVGRREPAAPVRTHTSLPSVWTPKTSCPPATACRAEKLKSCPVGRRTWISCRSSSQKAVNILSIATTSCPAKRTFLTRVAVTALPAARPTDAANRMRSRSEEHTSELQSRQYLVCR